MTKDRAILPGSERRAALGMAPIGPVDPTERLRVTVHLRRKEEPLPIVSRDQILTRGEFAALHGATASDMNAVEEFARGQGLDVVEASPAKRTVVLSGTVEAMSKAFGVTLTQVKVGQKTFRHRVGPITLPKDLVPLVVAVLGLDNRPQAEPQRRRPALLAYAPMRSLYKLRAYG